MTRVYPKIVAGTPAFFYSLNTGEFSFHYVTELPNGQPGTDATEIVIPAGVYPNGFDVSVLPEGAARNVTQSDWSVTIVVNPSPTPTHITVGIVPKTEG